VPVSMAARSEITTTEVAFLAPVAARHTWAPLATPGIRVLPATVPIFQEDQVAAAAVAASVKVAALISMAEGAKSLFSPLIFAELCLLLASQISRGCSIHLISASITVPLFKLLPCASFVILLNFA